MSGFHVLLPGHPPLPLDRERPELVLGRAPGLDLTLEDPTISRRHARLIWRQGTAWMEDLGSRHGCFKNGRRILAPEPVAPGDLLTLAQLPLALEAVPEAEGLAGLAPGTQPLTLALTDLRRWHPRGDQDRFANWGEALDLLHGLSLEMLQDREPEVLLGHLLDQLFSFLGATRGAVLVRNSAGELATVAARTREATAQGPLSIPPATLEATLGRRVAVMFRTPAPGGGQGRLAAFNTTSVMAVPLEHDDQVLGLFYFDASGLRAPFTELELRFVASLSNLAAAKLLAQRLAGELRRQQELERELQAREAAARAKGELLARVSHEIRTPMNIVLGFTHLAQKEPLTPRTAEYLGKIETSGRSLMRLVNELLDFSKLDADRLELEAIPFRLDQVLAEVLSLFAPSAAEKGVALSCAAQEGLDGELLGDPFRLGQVLGNLVGNAIKFTPQGEVRVRAARAGAAGVGPLGVHFSVQDTGIGIAPERLDRLFEPYSQADPGISRQYGGTGLGLAISRQLVARMGGSLTVASAATGSTFGFTLAFPRAPERLTGQEPEQGPGAVPRVPDLRGCRLLLVEDQALNRQLARSLLEETGAQVEEAGSGQEALDRLATVEYAAVLMDIQMPGLDGGATTRRARAMGHTLPILALTAQGAEGQRDAWLAAGMDAVVAKPIEPGLLFAALERWVPAPLRRPGPAQAAAGSAAPPRPAAGAAAEDPAAGAGAREVLDRLGGILDVPAAMSRMDGRAELLVGLLRDFLDDPIQPWAITAAMDRGDPEAARRLAHDLKGIARTLALSELADASAELEDRLQAVPPEGWEAACERLRVPLARFLAGAGHALGRC